MKARDFDRVFPEVMNAAHTIHFNLEGIDLTDYNESYRTYADAGSKDFKSAQIGYITATELRAIRDNSLWCQKTIFYKQGSQSLIQSPDIHQEICGS